MSYIILIIRSLLALGLIVIGLNKFFDWMGAPYKGNVLGFFNTLKTIGGGYLMYAVGTVEVLSGLSFITNKFVPLFAVILMPVMLNAFLFNVVLDPKGSGMKGATLFFLFNVALLILHRSAYANMLQP